MSAFIRKEYLIIFWSNDHELIYGLEKRRQGKDDKFNKYYKFKDIFYLPQ